MEYSNALYCDGPGTFHEILAHPTDPINKAIELWVGFEHRFAFFYWARWFKSMQQKRPGPPPTLVTFDHHRDLMRPGSHEKLELEKDDVATPNSRHVLAVFPLTFATSRIVCLYRTRNSSLVSLFTFTSNVPLQI